MGAPLLIVVDVQNGFVNDNSRRIVPDVVKLVERWHDLGGEVVATRFRNAPDSQWVRLLGWAKLMDSPEIDLVDEIKDMADVVLDKYSYTSLTDELVERLPDAPAPVFICGIDTDICVTKTAVDLFERGDRPIVVTDACASHAGIESHANALETLRRFIGRTQLLTSEEAEQEIQSAPSNQIPKPATVQATPCTPGSGVLDHCIGAELLWSVAERGQGIQGSAFPACGR